MARKVFHAPAIHCEGCAQSIQRSLGKLPGVIKTGVDIAAKTVDVEFDAEQTPESAIQERLALAGFPAEPQEG